MVLARIVVGANWGDEGKGLTTHNFAAMAAKNGLKAVNVLYNGGPQRGHTVELENGTRHVFHSFGSGTPAGAATYCDKDFMINPANFMMEFKELVEKGFVPKVYINSECRIITMYDVMLNQIVEKSRGDGRHGSCGMGIWECVSRYENEKFATIGEYNKMNEAERLAELTKAQNYAIRRLNNYYKITIPLEYTGMFLVTNSPVMKHYMQDFDEMLKIATIVPEKVYKEFLQNYDDIIFEGSQGLALDKDNEEEGDHVTASNTGALVPIERLQGIDCGIEVVYVTRTYFTRHGAGPFNECEKSDINPKIEDKTNVFNDYQRSIRYGKMDIDSLYGRINKDIAKWQKYEDVTCPFIVSLAITHLNYTYNMLGEHHVDNLPNGINHDVTWTYRSLSPTTGFSII